MNSRSSSASDWPTVPAASYSAVLRFGAASIEVVGIILALVPQDDGQGGEGAVVGEVFLGPKAAGVEEDGAEFERGIVGDAELPVRRKIAHGVLQVSVHDREQIGDLGRGGLVGLEPAVSLPLLQAHRDLLSARV